ncbi:NUDIX domain-containing protein [Streptomyces radicis]|uniref:NUDIX hydrolase n=1 Tax=Streptomyces radicis TaxID=1750517 RepID=A0A3A9W5A7_9ACTN|nr:NUDIX hydrolase [Streptomyces radicis]RKN08338.1 NUDIX hydrolase [Streptomyces radicis]RKN21626.1 NUDIX hydrolase [Streptomyces radicis]
MTGQPQPGTAEWQAYLAEGNARQARKRVAAGVILRDEGGRVLLVNPTYKEGWDLPGGMVEANESPRDAARRELFEELGIHPELRRVLLMDWDPPHGPWDDQIVVIFDGGTLSSAEAAGVHPCDHELSACAFFPPDDAVTAVRPRIGERVAQALEALTKGETRYLESGYPLEGPAA